METREKFEALPEIKIRLIGMVFCFSKNEYIPKNKILIEVVENTNQVNLAWYAFQEQEKRIVVIQHLRNNQYESLMSVKNKCDELTKSLKDCFHNMDSQDKEIIQDYIEEIKELLK